MNSQFCTLNRREKNSKNKINYRKNESGNDHTFSLNFVRLFSQRILSAGPKGLRTKNIGFSAVKKFFIKRKILKNTL